MFSVARDGQPSLYYLSDLLQGVRQLSRFQNLFEAYRKYGDNSLFVTGIFPKALRHRRRGRWARAVAFVDRSYYVSTGKRCYRLAAQHDMAQLTQQRELLEKLSAYFDVYRDALNELSERYIMGFDHGLIADKMLDNFNQYRRTRQEHFLLNARRYAAILIVDPDAFPSLMKRGRPRAYPAQPPSGH